MGFGANLDRDLESCEFLLPLDIKKRLFTTQKALVNR